MQALGQFGMSDDTDAVALLGQLAGGLLGLLLSTYLGGRAWRGSAEDWRALNQRWRPKSWRSWPVYSVIWRHFDEHTTRYLWCARVVLPLAVAVCLAGCVYVLVLLARIAL